MLARLDARSAAARRGVSDLAIRNLFIIPTIVFLIVFNIFPLIYSLGYSFTDFRASVNTPANFVGLQNYRELLGDEYIWSNFTITAKYVLVSVGGQVLVGFGVALLLNRAVPGKGLVTTLLLLPMMLSMAVVGLFCAGIYEGKAIERGLAYLKGFLPGPGRSNITEARSEHYFYGHYYAALAMWTAGGNLWAEWFPAIRNELVTKARTGHGGVWNDWHGAAYATAMACIILQLPNNYLPIMQK